jgi:DnaK suppressor protein
VRDDIDNDAFRTHLIARREELLEAAKDGKDGTRPVELDQTRVGRLSRMDALQVQAMAQATQGRVASELRRIEVALERLDSGDYGYCVSCDEPIAVKRLEIDPAIPTCIDCASRTG